MTEPYDDEWNPDEMLEAYMRGSTDLPPQPTSEVDALIDSFKYLTGSPEQRIKKMTALIGQLANPSQKRNLGKPVNWEQWLEENDDDSYDWVIPGLLERTDRLICVAAEGVGKRATITSMIPTPSGWTKLGDLVIGDQVFDRFGKPCTVTYVSPIELNPDAYRVTFSDGNYVDADAEHQWYTETLNERERRKLGSVRTTLQIKETLVSTRASQALNHAIPTTLPLDLPEVQLPIPPYTLGAWLGDGSTVDGCICSEDPEILASVEAEGFEVRLRPSTKNMYGILGLKANLRQHGVLGNKHIPAIYSRASYEQRLALVQGLMDTDGTVRSDGLCEFSVNLKELAEGFLDLILTLGIKATIRTGESKLNGRVTGTRYRVSFKTDLPVVRLSRKAERLPAKLATSRSLYRYIVSVESIPPSPMRCISVDGPDNTYLIGEAYIPTHNTMLARQIAICVAAGIHPFTGAKIEPVDTLTVDLENPKKIIQRTSRKIMHRAQERSRSGAPIRAELIIEPSGINLLRQADQDWLEEQIAETRPGIVFIGPLYKSFIDPGGRSSESVATEVAMYYDYLRNEYQCALWMEMHAPLGNAVSGRDLRPFGSAVWSRWPEFGLAIERDAINPEGYKFKYFRGARDKRDFPLEAHRGGPMDFPYVVDSYMTD